MTEGFVNTEATQVLFERLSAWFSITFVLYCLATIVIYQCFALLQRKTGLLWLNPMLLSVIVIIPLLTTNHISFGQYYEHSQIFTHLLELAIVALGYPLYQQLSVIRAQFKQVVITLSLSIVIMLVVNLSLAIWLVNNKAVAVSLSLKSITTPIGLALTEQFNGIAAITAVAIIIAGLVGGVFGPKFLTAFGITCARSQGLAIGCASHALGTASISHLSYQHGAFSSLALVLSALITAVVCPLIIPLVIGLL